MPEDGRRARHLAAAGDREAAHDLARRAVDGAASPGERAAHLAIAAATADGPAANELRLAAATAMRVAGELDGAMTVLDALADAGSKNRAKEEAIGRATTGRAASPEAMRAAFDRGLR